MSVTRRARAAAWTVVAMTSSTALALFTGAGVAKANYVVPTGSYDATAQAIALNATIANPSIPLGLVIEGLGPEASSRVNSSGTSDAEASFPYLGPVAPGLIGIAAGLYGLPWPGYPLQATTSAGEAPRTVTYPGIRLHAESGNDTNVGSASVSGPAGGGTADTRISVNSSGGVTAVADTALDAVNLGNGVRLAGVLSTARVVADGTTGKLVRTSSLSIGRITVPGLAITVPKTTPGAAPIPIPLPGVPQLPDTQFPTIPLPFGGQTLPAPDLGFVDGVFTMTLPGFGSTEYAVPAAAVLEAFEAAGLNMSYQPAEATPTGVTGAAFNLRTEFPAPPDNPYAYGSTSVSYSVGNVAANVTFNKFAPESAAGVDGAVPGSAAPDAVGAVPDLDPVDAAGLPATVPGLVPAVTGGVPVDQAAPVNVARLLPVHESIDLTSYYVALFVVALAALAAMTILRLLGVRSLWSS
ncbi:hypothetical protein GCM10009547_07440 [Sporichthya brevicatena]|uniref:Uncharacterized protein n=1 Tax=Sporichthya brevicatena TaxID=171442 RepID=A0ABP3RIX6_9ACTN